MVAKKRPPGRPKEYTAAVVKRIVAKLPEMFIDGQSVEEVLVELKMCKHTFYRLVDEYSSFSDAYKRGLDYSAAWWNRLGREGSSGVSDIQPATWIFNMKNRFGWVDKQEFTGAGGNDLFGAFAAAVSKNKKGAK